MCATGVAPFPGATTGTGGRIRDVHAAGRGAHVVAGTAGYSFGNLHIPGNHNLLIKIVLSFSQNTIKPVIRQDIGTKFSLLYD